MSEIETRSGLSSLAVPSSDDDAAWEDITRQQQLAALQELANHPDQKIISDLSPLEILERHRKLNRQTRIDEPKL